MANNPKSLIRKFSISITDVAARALDQEEREAVLGDLAESRGSELQNFREVAGLVLRRRAIEWRHWRPWLTWFALILPLGFFLSVVSRLTAQQTSVYLWLYANNPSWDLIQNRGFWYELGNATLLVFAVYLKLACWAWAAGFVIGCATRKMWRSGYFALIGTLFASMICASIYLPRYMEWVLRGRFIANLPPHEDPVSQVLFYRSLLPIITELFIVTVPAISGMRHGQERSPSVFRYSVVLLSILVVGDMLLHNSILWIKLWGAYSMARAMRILHPETLSLAAYWPAAYLLLRNWRQRQRLAAG